MAAIAFDPLEYTHALEDAGFTRSQAELVAQVGTAMFVQNFDALVTRDYLDTRFAELEVRVLSVMELRFKDVDAKFSKLYIMGGIIMASTVIPNLQKFFAWLG